MTTSSRPRWHIAAAIVQMALLLVAQAADGTGIHRCRDHDAGLGVRIGQEHGAGHHPSGGSDDRGGHHGPCPCLGAGIAVSLPLPPARAMQPAKLASVAPVRHPAPGLPALAQPAHTLPFAIGPPVSA